MGGLFTPTPAEVAREHGVFGPTIDQSEGMAMNQHNPVAAALESARPGPVEPERRRSTTNRTGQSTGTANPIDGGRPRGRCHGGRAAAGTAGEQSGTGEGDFVSEILDISRGESLQPQQTPTEQAQDQDLGHSR